MVLLLDTNVVLDYLINRPPFTGSAKALMQKCQEEITGCVAAHSIINIFYILRKQYSFVERKTLLFIVCEILEVVGISKFDILAALIDENFDDVEDFLQAECAQIVGADYIITRNIDDFINSPIPAILPDTFLQMLEHTTGQQGREDN
jgi:predicted nucleic acid-binding protein